ncbi:NAD(P)H:quinone oxidoreductase [Commensalibacter papalotli (ex Servin-Garciduenas et al. 2014)]|uniref:NAD(P)H dehydrogenase (quinone) n=1 Tax=Commensalibacter papalotli (ex Servin-Garciduenas et al. 2014) TaxID=1208583 RepID=W7DP71_9PROT|nr:NAD(P)H:quinone oxidoreductase [Commensalibacter papalotli (ex Servin-Garciduenas et al. 2014)]EUK19117.1 NAD(P)H:quinone oxidoreductase [Commensalibacter papalotli (ex Servin-Garciduenas et al. 2014)]
MSARILILYYSSYGHIETMAYAIAKGIESSGATAVVKRVPETVPEEIARKNHFKLDQTAQIATPGELADYDGIILGTGTRFGRISSQMASFLDQTGGLWAKGALIGKVGGAFTSTGTQHAGQEMTLMSLITNLMHYGMTIASFPFTFAGLSEINEVTGGTPYGASTIAGPDGSRAVSQNELNGAEFFGKHVAEITKKLSA